MSKLVQLMVHSFNMTDVEDPDIYVASPILDWQKTELGKWVMEHGVDPSYSIQADIENYGYKVIITSKFTESDATFFSLKYK